MAAQDFPNRLTPSAPKKSGAGQQTVETVEAPFFRGSAALVQFAGDADGAGPASASTIWYLDPKTSKLRPILSEEAFDNVFSMSLKDAAAQGLITKRPLTDLNKGNVLGEFELLTDAQGIGPDYLSKQQGQPTDTVDTNSLLNPYGQQQDAKVSVFAAKQLDGFLNLLKSDPQSGVSSATIDNILNDLPTRALYTAALGYGNYQLPDIFRDIKRKELVQSGRTDLANVKVIDNALSADQYFATPAGSTARTQPDLTPPRYLGNIDTGLLNNSIFKLDPKLYEILVPPLDFSTPEGQAKLNDIKDAYHDVLLQMVDATTQSEQAVAQANLESFNKDLERKYGISLSNNAQTAWNQLSQIGANFSERGLYQSGIQNEAMDRYLNDIRRSNTQMREEKLSAADDERRKYLMTSSTPAEIAALTDEEKQKYGFKPSAETIAWFSPENLKKLYPDLSDEEIGNYSKSVLDDNGNYRSQLFQKAMGSKLDIGQQKKSTQMGGVQYDANGNIISASGAIGKNALETESAYRPFSMGTAFSKDSGIGQSTSTPTPAPTPKLPVPDSQPQISSMPEGWEVGPDGHPRKKNTASTPTPAQAFASTGSLTDKIKIKSKFGDTQDIMRSDLDYWKSQRWN